MVKVSGMIKVGIAEDQVIFRKGLIDLLSTFPGVAVVYDCENGQKMADFCKGNEIDLVILDFRMPVLNGIETTRLLRKVHSDLKILILSMYDTSEFVESSIEAGANGYLSKDDDPEEIKRAIYSVMETGYYLNDRTSKMLIAKMMDQGKINPNFGEGIQPDFNASELQILQFICEELTTQEIADKCFKSKRTIESARTSMMQKIGARNVVGLVMYAVKNNLVQL